MDKFDSLFQAAENEMFKKAGEVEDHSPTNKDPVFFYEREFYPLSNFSSFRLIWEDWDFDTSEHAYHWEKFPGEFHVRDLIKRSRSAHEAYQIAQNHKHLQREDWYEVRVHIMKRILQAKVEQHEYVYRKLMQTEDRPLIENSWRDPFWGWGIKKDGKNVLGNLWMEVRTELQLKLVEGAVPL
jgi:ribA/ribD-fused uncharacterized protein